MATTFWTGNGQNVAQVSTIVITAVAVNGTLSATINGKSITYTCVTGDTIATAGTGWLALLQASTVPAEFAEITWAFDGTATITATAGTPGTPFTLTKSQAGGATCTLTATTANSSQSDVNNSANWLRSGSASLPQNGDDVVVANTSIPLLWNLDQLASVQFLSFTRYQSFTGTIGLPDYNANGYYEYRPTYFQFSGSAGTLPLSLGLGVGSGPTRERYNLGTKRYALTVVGAGSPADEFAVRVLGTHANNTLTIVGTSVGVATFPGESSTLDVVTVDGGGSLTCGPTVTFTGTGGGGTLTLTGGSATLYCAPAAIVARNSAVLSLAGSSLTFASITANNGVQISLLTAMTISVLTLQKGSTLNNSANLGAVTLTTSTLDGDTCQILDPNNSITYTNATTVNGQVTSGPFVFTGQKTVKVT